MRNLGIVRNQDSITKGLSDIIRIERESRGMSAKLNDMILVSKFIICGAFKREESRGCHLRSDFPKENINFLRHFDQSKHTLEKDILNIIDRRNNIDKENILAS